MDPAALIELLRVEEAPLCPKDPAVTQGAERVKTPEFTMLMEPRTVVVTAPLNVTFVPVRLMPLAVLVFVAPLKVVVPVPPVWSIDAALMDPNVAVAVSVMRRAPMRVFDPMAPVTVILSAPLASVRFWAPSTEPLIEIKPGPGPLLSVNGALRLTIPAKLIFWLRVKTVPPIKTGPKPL